MTVTSRLALHRSRRWSRLLTAKHLWNASIICLVLAAAVRMLSTTVVDPDLWGHLRFGQDFWQTGRVAQIDPYSYLSAGRRWINHEWLAEAIFALIFAVGGAPGLIALKTLVSVLIVALVYQDLLVRGLAPLRAGLLLILGIILLAPGLTTVRPQLFTYLLFLLVVLLVHRAGRNPTRSLWALPPLFALWANVHGGFLAGLALLSVWSAARLLVDGRRAWYTLPVALGSVAATCLNPYGPVLLAFLLRTATVPRPEISEWHPVSLVSIEGIGYLLLLGLALAGLVFSRRERSPVSVALFAVLALLPVLAVRHLQLYALGALVLTGEHIGDAWDRRISRSSAGASHTSLLLAGFSVVAAVGLLWLARPNFACIRVAPPNIYPVNAVALLKETAATGNLAVDFDWGEYALWHLGPRVKVSVDGRRETVYSDEVYAQNLQFIHGVGDWDAILQGGADFALVRQYSATANLIKLTPGWVLTHEGPTSALFVREASPHFERLAQASVPTLPHDGEGLCFP